MEGGEGEVFGVVRYIGDIDGEMSAGVEMEEEVVGAHNGWLQVQVFV